MVLVAEQKDTTTYSEKKLKDKKSSIVLKKEQHFCEKFSEK